ncbi:MAG: hypothetical protein NVSMB68_08320 [Thermoanaerobaculia bacterium]
MIRTMSAAKRTDPRISDASVVKATGRGWKEWFALLDRRAAGKLAHKDIVAIVKDNGGGMWWSQMVTVTYEQQRGLRELHQRADGFATSVSRTISAPIDDLFAAWNNARRRSRWLKNRLTLRKSAKNKSLRITWPAGDSQVEVSFYDKGKGKSQVTVQHSKLRDRDDVAGKKSFWAEALQKLKEHLDP